MKKMLKSKKGFTMVEIIIVLVIIAILIGASVPAMIGFVNEARGKGMAAEATSVRTALQSAVSEYIAMNPGDSDDIADATTYAELIAVDESIETKIEGMLGGEIDTARIAQVAFDDVGRVTQVVLLDTPGGTRWINLVPGQAATTGDGTTPPAPTPTPVEP